MSHSPKSDLIDLVHHENDHMTKLFGDLQKRFERLGSDDTDDGERREVVEVASEDLKTAFDELLHHFSQEEEVFFVEMEQRFPNLSETIAELVETHEFICERTRWLENLLHQDVTAIAANLERIGETLGTLQSRLLRHTETENEVFGAALLEMTPAEREQLLRRMREIG